MNTEGSNLYKVYSCPGCKHVGYEEISDTEQECYCSLCGALILQDRSTLYAENQEQARALVARVSLTSTRQESQVIRGLGKRRRILRMIQALQDLQRGRAVPVEDLLKECEYAGIKEETAKKFLDVLIEQDFVVQRPEGLVAREAD